MEKQRLITGGAHDGHAGGGYARYAKGTQAAGKGKVAAKCGGENTGRALQYIEGCAGDKGAHEMAILSLNGDVSAGQLDKPGEKIKRCGKRQKQGGQRAAHFGAGSGGNGGKAGGAQQSTHDGKQPGGGRCGRTQKPPRRARISELRLERVRTVPVLEHFGNGYRAVVADIVFK